MVTPVLDSHLRRQMEDSRSSKLVTQGLPHAKATAPSQQHEARSEVIGFLGALLYIH